MYPEDFRIPNEIYNDVTKRYLDIKADSELLHQYEYELEFFNEYTEKFRQHFEFIAEKVSAKMLDRTAYEGVFYYADIEVAESLYREGCNLLNDKPKGVKAIIFGHKWRQLAAVYYRRAENFVMSIQQKTIRLAEKIYK